MIIACSTPAFGWRASAQSPVWPPQNAPVCAIGEYEPPAPVNGRAAGLEQLLDCMWERESSRGANMFGDGGLAFGHYQIHIDKHPVSYDCAMDFDCSRDYARTMILAGKGWLWTSYRKCL